MARTIWAIWVPKLFLFARVFSLVHYNIISVVIESSQVLAAFCSKTKCLYLSGLSTAVLHCPRSNKSFKKNKLQCNSVWITKRRQCRTYPGENWATGTQNKIQLSYCWLGTSLLCYVMWSCEMRQSPFVQRRASSDSKNADWLTFVINLKTTIPVQVIIGGADNVWNVCMKAAEWHRNISLPGPVSKKMTFARSPPSDKTIICHFLSLLQVPLSYRE